MRKFAPNPHAIKAQAAIDIAAAPEQVAAIYRDVEKWGETSGTIERAQVSRPAITGQIEVTHKMEVRSIRSFSCPTPRSPRKARRDSMPVF
jgi:hypothetical protein